MPALVGADQHHLSGLGLPTTLPEGSKKPKVCMGMARIGAGAGFEEGKTLYNGDNLFSFIFHPVTAVGKSGAC